MLDVSPEMRDLLGEVGHDFHQLQEHAARMGRLKADLPEIVWKGVHQDLSDTPEGIRAQRLTAYEKAVVFLRDEVGDLEDLPYAVVKSRAMREISNAAPQVEVTNAQSAGLVTVDHNFVEGRTRATLLFTDVGRGLTKVPSGVGLSPFAP